MGSLAKKLTAVALSATLIASVCPATAFSEEMAKSDSFIVGEGDLSALPEASISIESASERAVTPASDFEYAIGDYIEGGNVKQGSPTLYVDERIGYRFDGHTGDTIGITGYECGRGVYITRYTGSDSSIVVPESIDGVPVVYVGLFNPNLEIETLDVSRCSSLKAFDCYGLTFRLVEFGNIEKVQNVLFTQMSITSRIDMKSLTDLRQLSFYGSNFASFSIDGPSLESFYCGITNANSLNLAGCVNLTELTCTNNPLLTSLSLSNLPALRELTCFRNNLASLDISGCGNLTYLSCQENRILDVSALEAWLAQDGHDGQVLPQNEYLSGTATRLGGDDRYDTMALVSQAAFPDAGSCSTVIVARGDNFPDALAAAGLAGVTGGQVLLTETSTLTDETRAEISRLGATKAYVIGDVHSVTARTFNEIESLVGGDATRLGGADRLDTAVKIYEAGKGRWGSTAIVATGKKAADSLSVSPLAYSLKAPIFLADDSGNLAQGSLGALAKGGFTKILVLGDAYSVSNSTFSKLEKLAGSVERIGGTDRYQTSLLTAEWALENGFTCNAVSLTAGREGKFADALVASSLGGRYDSPLLLVDDGTAGAVCISKVLAPNKVQVAKAYMLGDKYTVSDATAKAIQEALA